MYVDISWKELAVGCTTFSARCQHTISFYSRGQCAIIYGGYNVRTKYLGDVWVMDLSTHSLWQASDHGELPHARRGHVAQVIEDRLWIFGGANDTEVLGDVMCLCLKTWQWTKVCV